MPPRMIRLPAFDAFVSRKRLESITHLEVMPMNNEKTQWVVMLDGEWSADRSWRYVTKNVLSYDQAVKLAEETYALLLSEGLVEGNWVPPPAPEPAEDPPITLDAPFILENPS